MFQRIFIIAGISGILAGAEAPPFDWNRTRDKAFAAVQNHDYEQALTLCQQLWERAANEVERASASQDMGTVLVYAGHEREAAVWLQRTMEQWQKVAGKPERLPQAMQQLGVVYGRLGDYAEAERLFREALAKPQVGTVTRMKTVNALADLLREQGRSAEAGQLLQQPIVSAGLPWYVQIESAMEIAGQEREAGSAQESTVRWNDALQLARANHSVAYEAICLRGLGESWLERHETARALPLLRRSVFLLESIDSPDPTQREIFQLANSRRSLAEAELMDRKPLEAEELAERAIQDVTRASLENHPQAAALFDILAEAQASRARLGPALQSLEKAHAILAAHFGESSIVAIATAAKRGVLEERAGQPEDAVRDLGAAIAIMGRDHSDLARTRRRLLEYYAAALEATHRKQQAKAVRAELKTTVE